MKILVSRGSTWAPAALRVLRISSRKPRANSPNSTRYQYNVEMFTWNQIDFSMADPESRAGSGREFTPGPLLKTGGKTGSEDAALFCRRIFAADEKEVVDPNLFDYFRILHRVIRV